MSDVVRMIEVGIRIAKEGPFTFRPIGGTDHPACCFCGVMAANPDNLRNLSMHPRECLYRQAVEAYQ